MCCGSGDIQMGMGGVGFPYSTPYNTLGVGNAVPPGGWMHYGSGDLFGIMGGWRRPIGKPGPGRPPVRKAKKRVPSPAPKTYAGTFNMAPRPLLVMASGPKKK